MSGDIVERLREAATLKRDCSVCDGDGIKDSGRPCGGCNETGKVFVYPPSLREAMSSGATALLQVEALTRALERIAKMEGAVGLEDAGASKLTMGGVVTHGRVKRTAFANDIAAEALRSLSKEGETNG